MGRFFKLESASGIVLLLAAVFALTLANSPASTAYFEFTTPLHGIINDGLMSIFFFLVGLEIKREFVKKEVKSFKAISLPIVAALGGMLFPALIFLLINPGTNAWAVAMPTDIALALGGLALLGGRIEPALKIFLLTLAIADDLFSIIILGIFYSGSLDPLKIAGTIGAVLIGLLLPYKNDRLIEAIHPWSAFFIIPAFALVNIGVKLNVTEIFEPLSTGLILGRVLGKIVGITLFSYLAVKFSISYKEKSLTYTEIAGAGALAAMGLTVSLFIADLSALSVNQMDQVKLGLIISAILGGVIGLLLLRFLAKNPASTN